MTATLESVRFEVLGPPRPKERPRLGKGGRTYTPPRTVQYERAVRQVAAVHCGHWRRDGLYRVTLTFVFASEPRGDTDNYAKGALDGLQGVAFDNDRQVVELSARKSVQPGRLERTEVLVERMGDAPGARSRRRG